MKPELYQHVSLTADFPEYNLKTGDVATLVEYVPGPQGTEDGCVLEVFNAVGESITVVTVPQSSITALNPDEILHVRRLTRAG